MSRFTFGKPAVERIKAAVLKSERSPPTRPDQGGPRLWNPGILEAIVTTAITPASVAGGVVAYGKGKAQIIIDHTVAGTTNSIHDPSFPNPVDVLSTSTTIGGVPVGTNIGVFWRNGRWGLAFVDCAN